MVASQGGSYFRNLRLSRSIGLRRFAKLVGDSPSNICGVEQGRRGLPQNIEKLTKWADVLDLSLDERDQLFKLGLRPNDYVPQLQIATCGNRDEDTIPAVLKERAQVRPLPFCPDHRDKVRGLSCRQCLIESLQKTIEIAIDRLDPEMGHYEIITLREKLIQRANDLSQ